MHMGVCVCVGISVIVHHSADMHAGKIVLVHSGAGAHAFARACVHRRGVLTYSVYARQPLRIVKV